MKTVPVLSTVNCFVAEGAVGIYSDMVAGLKPEYTPTTLALHSVACYDSTVQIAAQNRSYQQLVAARVPVHTLDRMWNSGPDERSFTFNERERAQGLLRAARVLLTLESGPVGITNELWTPPGITCMYRSAPEMDPALESLRQAVAAGRIVACTFDSETARDNYAAAGIRPPIMKIVDDGIDLDRFRPSPTARGEGRKKLGIPDEASVVLLVARLNADKDIDLFLASAAIYLRQDPTRHAVMIGNGLNYGNPELMKLIEHRFAGDTSLLQRLHCPEPSNHMEGIYPIADVTTLTSRCESNPLCLKEALASDCAVVSTDVGDVRRVLEDCGIVVPDRNPQAIAAAWAEAQQRHERGELALSNAKRQSFGRPAMISGYKKVIGTVLANA